jgi:hypothetical protein
VHAVTPPSAIQFVVGLTVVPQQVPRAEMMAGLPKEVTFAPSVAPVVVIEVTVGEETVGTAAATVYVPLKAIVPPEVSVRLCDAGVLYPDTAPQVMV